MPLTIDRLVIDGATREALAPLGLPEPVADDWSRFAPPQVRTLLVARGGSGEVVGAAITTARPLAAYLKIGGVWTADNAAAGNSARDGGSAQVARALVIAAEELAWEAGCTVVKREHRPDQPGSADGGCFGPEAGYVAVPAPDIRAPIPDPGPVVPSAWFKWRTAAPSATVPYMRQTTDFTCGTASLSMLLARSGIIDTLTRAHEIDLWRQATTIEACDPYGLAVTADRQGLRPAIVISTPETLFTEKLPSEQERELREFIQDGFRDEAGQLGIKTELRTFDVAELRDLVAAGGAAIVLCDTVLVTGEVCPHWIVVHGLHSDAPHGGQLNGAGGEYFLAHDPWTEWGQGESWVDAYQVPLTADALDKIAWTGDPAVRAMLTFVPRGR